MIPTRLNLLPKERKKKLERIIYFQFFKGVMEILVFMLCISSIALVGGAWTMQEYYNELAKQTLTSTKKYESINKRMSAINDMIHKAEKIQNKNYLWTPILVEFSSTTPESVFFETVNMDYNKREVVITGSAPTRDDLLLVESTINNHPLLGTAEIPPSSLTAKENIPFLITTDFNK
ncbi:MAG: hypothetical protein GF349_05045 [Candidatus Magasanikbacteria bacterium]|nr:hypothetical protein [Candidatus Magasanikbacteria bacterium]